MRVSSLLSVIGTISVASAQIAAYGQCGGETYSGSTTCVSGYYCAYSSAYYSQCIPGTGSGSGSGSATTTAAGGGGSTTTTAPSSGSSSISSYAKVHSGGKVFEINGKATYFAGTNCYWCSFLTNNADVDLVMGHVASTGLKVLRVWGFNDVTSTPGSGTVWFQSFTGSSPTINTGADGLQRLDYVVQSAEAHGISLIINFVNNWTDYGGMAAYVSYYGLSEQQDWYTSSAAQAQYQKYIQAVVSRYKTSTAIFAWELANEPRCNACATSVITQWATTTSAYIKSLDSNHMVTMGDEGFGLTSGTSDDSYPFTTGEGLSFTNNLAIPDIDFGTYHLYPSSWSETDSWGPLWVTAHATAASSAGKPVIAEEYGSTTHADEASWQSTMLSTNTAGDMYWQFGDTLSSGQSSNDGYTIYYGSSEYTTLVTDHAAAMNAKAVS